MFISRSIYTPTPLQQHSTLPRVTTMAFILQEPSYPLCNIPDHHPDSTIHIHDVSVSTTIPRAVLHDNDALVPPSPADSDVPSPSGLTSPIHVDEPPMDAPLLDNNTSVPASFHPPCQTGTGSVQDSSTSPDPAAAAATRDNTSTRTMPPTTCETSMSASSASPPAAVSLQNNADLLVPSDASEIPSSVSPVLDAITGPFLLTTHFLSQSLTARYWLRSLQALHHGRLLHLFWTPLKVA
jgi:hypothetical protein